MAHNWEPFIISVTHDHISNGPVWNDEVSEKLLHSGVEGHRWRQAMIFTTTHPRPTSKLFILRLSLRFSTLRHFGSRSLLISWLIMVSALIFLCVVLPFHFHRLGTGNPIYIVMYTPRVGKLNWIWDLVLILHVFIPKNRPEDRWLEMCERVRLREALCRRRNKWKGLWVLYLVS